MNVGADGFAFVIHNSAANLGGSGGRRGPSAGDLLPDGPAWGAFAVSGLGAALLVAGFAARQRPAFVAGAALGALGSLVHLSLLLGALSRALRSHRVRRAIPGMES